MDGSRKFIIVSTAVALLIIILVSCTLAYAGRDNTLMSDKSLNLKVNGFSLELPLSENEAIYDPVCLSSVSENIIKLNNEVGATVRINNKNLKTGATISLELDRLSADNLITIEVGNEKDRRVIYLRTLSSQLPKLTSAGESVYEGNYYATLANGETGLYEINQQGEVVFYMADSDVSNQNVIYSDFQKHILENGKIRYSYQQTDKDSHLGERIILDENHEYLETITLEASDYAKEGEGLKSDAFVLIDDDHWITATKQLILSHNIPEGLNANSQGTRIQRVLIQEVNDEKVINEFVSDAYPELYGLAGNIYGSTPSEGIDYTGFNDLVLDPEDGNLILSFSAMNMLLKIDRETGDILWKLSGVQDEFGLTAEQKLTKPTAISLDEEGNLVFFDYGEKQNRIVQLKLDEENKTLQSYEEIMLIKELSNQGGSVVKVSDTQSVFGISWGITKEGNSGISETDFSVGAVLLEIRLPQGIYFNSVQRI